MLLRDCGKVIFVLIDTWWNVNTNVWFPPPHVSCFNRYMVECKYYHSPEQPLHLIVLIDTWWNVNSKEYWSITIGTSFNRYMVECKFARLWWSRFSVSVLIDTWWNVNEVRGQKGGYYDKVLIDTWWNVNAHLQAPFSRL